MARASGLLLILASAALLAVNTVLNVWLPVLLNTRPERLRLTYDVAWMLAPGKVHVRGLSIRQQSMRDQWLLVVDRAVVHIDLWSLVDRRFRITQAQASGASFRWRGRADVGTGSPAPGEPTIEGLTNPPDPTPESLYPLAQPWRVELENLDIQEVREIWFGEYLFSGDVAVSGSMIVQARTWLEAESVKMTVNDGQLMRGEELLVSAVHGDITFDLVGSEPKEMVGRSLLGAMSGTVALKARVQGLRFLEYYLASAHWFDLRGGEGAIALDLLLEDGTFRSGSQVEVEMANLAARIQTYTVVGDGKVLASVSDEGGLPQTTVRVDLFDVEIREQGAESPLVKGPEFHLKATTPDVAIDRPFTTLSVELDLPQAQIPDLSLFQAYLPHGLGLAVRSGTGTIQGHMRVSSEQGDCEGEARVNARDMVVSLDTVRMMADVNVVGRVVHGNLGTGEYDISGSSVELRGVKVLSGSDARDGKDDSRDWWAVMTLPQGSVAVGAPTFLKGRLALECRDTVPFVTIFSARSKLPGWVRGLLRARPVKGSAWVSIGDHYMRVSDMKLTAGKFRVQLELNRGRRTEGKLFAQYGKVSIGMGLAKDKNRIHLMGARKWYNAEPDPH